MIYVSFVGLVANLRLESNKIYFWILHITKPKKNIYLAV